MRLFFYNLGLFIFLTLSIPTTMANNAIETVWLDTYSSVGVEYIEAQSTTVLEAGIPYILKVRGTISVWSPSVWEQNPPCGNPDDSPQYPSPDTANGMVSNDAAFSFGSAGHSSACNFPFPSARSFRASLDDGNTVKYLYPENAYNTDHLYTYRIVGEGHPLKVRFFDSYYQVDNYGQFKIDIYPDTACQLYGVHDAGLNNSQFFTVFPHNFNVQALGELYQGLDIEALDMHPQTNELFAASGRDTQKPGYLYKVDVQTGGLTEIGATGFKEVDGLSFAPDGNLWGWATYKGLVSIDTITGAATLMYAYPSREIEDITWSTDGKTLYIAANVVDNDPDMGTILFSYDVTNSQLNTVCQAQTAGQEIEALDTLADGSLIMGFHQDNMLKLGAIDPETCLVITNETINASSYYDDVEGISWPNCQ